MAGSNPSSCFVATTAKIWSHKCRNLPVCHGSIRLRHGRQQRISMASSQTNKATDELQSQQVAVMLDKIKVELDSMFGKLGGPVGKVNDALYSKNVVFQDPLNNFTGINKYKWNIGLLTDSFVFSSPEFELYELQPRTEADRDGNPVIMARWMLSMLVSRVPWKPRLRFTGTTMYVLDKSDGYKIVKHIDTWDNIANQSPVSLEALQDVIGQMLTGGTDDDTSTPKYKLIRRTKEYEIREYEPFTTAETAYSTRPEGLMILDSYFSGRNDLKIRIPKAIPLILEFEGTNFDGDKRMGVPIPESKSNMKSGKSSPYPIPLEDSGIQLNRRTNMKVAVIQFDGSMTPEIAKYQKYKLTEALKRDGINMSSKTPRSMLAQYTAVYTVPWQRKNEVWIDVA